jgi:hypothetical protein
MPQAGALHQLLAMDPKKIVQKTTALNWSSSQGKALTVQSPAPRGDRKIHSNYTGGTFSGRIRVTLSKAIKIISSTL